jgi:hypothetical protein
MEAANFFGMQYSLCVLWMPTSLQHLSWEVCLQVISLEHHPDRYLTGYITLISTNHLLNGFSGHSYYKNIGGLSVVQYMYLVIYQVIH